PPALLSRQVAKPPGEGARRQPEGGRDDDREQRQPPVEQSKGGREKEHSDQIDRGIDDSGKKERLDRADVAAEPGEEVPEATAAGRRKGRNRGQNRRTIAPREAAGAAGSSDARRAQAASDTIASAATRTDGAYPSALR